MVRQLQEQWQARFAVSIHTPTDEHVEEAALQLEQATDEMPTFANDLTARRLLGDEYHAALETRVRAAEEAEASLKAAGSKRVQAALSQLSWDWLDPAETREVLAGALDAVYVRRGKALPIESRAYLVWAGELDDDVPARGRAADTLRSFAWPDEN